MLVGASRKIRADRVARDGTCAIATGEEARFELERRAVGAYGVRRDDPIALFDRRGFRAALDLHPFGFEMRDEQSFVLILWEDHAVRERTSTDAGRPDVDVGRELAAAPKVDAVEDERAIEHILREADLPIDLERPGLHRERSRRRPRALGRVHDACTYT